MYNRNDDRRTIKKIVIITSYVLYSYSKNKVMQILYLFQYFKALPCFHSKTENLNGQMST